VSYTKLKAKCMACGLHFVVCTEQPEQRKQQGLCCPECGQKSKMVVWVEPTEGFIFQEVPGKSGIGYIQQKGGNPRGQVRRLRQLGGSSIVQTLSGESDEGEQTGPTEASVERRLVDGPTGKELRYILREKCSVCGRVGELVTPKYCADCWEEVKRQVAINEVQFSVCFIERVGIRTDRDEAQLVTDKDRELFGKEMIVDWSWDACLSTLCHQVEQGWCYECPVLAQHSADEGKKPVQPQDIDVLVHGDQLLFRGKPDEVINDLVSWSMGEVPFKLVVHAVGEGVAF
jgi:hypothetical protein